MNLVREIQELPHAFISEISAFHGRMKWMEAGSITTKVSYADGVIVASIAVMMISMVRPLRIGQALGV